MMSKLHAPLAKTGPKGEWGFRFGQGGPGQVCFVEAHNWFSARARAVAMLGCPASEAVCVRNPTL